MSARKNDDPELILEQYDQAIDGMTNAWPASQPSIVIHQQSYTPSTLAALFQTQKAPFQKVVDLRSELRTALANREAAIPAAMDLLASFYAVLPQYLPPGTDTSTFGKKPKKARAPLTAAQKEAANEKRNATRAARHIMGKKQRKAIKAAPPASPPAPPGGSAPAK
jgi:hypothetical protein